MASNLSKIPYDSYFRPKCNINRNVQYILINKAKIIKAGKYSKSIWSIKDVVSKKKKLIRKKN